MKKSPLVVYRIEHSTRGVGPWFGPGYSTHVGAEPRPSYYSRLATPYDETWDRNQSSTTTAVLLNREYRCAFATLNEIRQWFGLCASELRETGYVVRRYVVAKYLVGKQQVVYDPKSILKKHTLPFDRTFGKTVA